MEKIISVLTVCILFLLGTIIVSYFLLLQNAVAFQTIAYSTLDQLQKSNHNLMSHYNQHLESLHSLYSSSKMTDALTSSFSNIIYTQIDMGLEK